MAKKKTWISFRTVLAILTAVLVAYVVYQNWPDILETVNDLSQTNILVLLLLVPEQLFMYFACGQIFFSYLENRKNSPKASNAQILRISTELNFVNRAIPVGGIGGLAFLTYRLRPFDVSAGQTSFLYVFRYAITTVVNYAQALIATIVLLVLGLIPPESYWIIPIALLLNTGFFAVLGLVVFIASSHERIDFFSRLVEKSTNFLIKIFTFNRKKSLKNPKIRQYFNDIHDSVMMAKTNRKNLKKPTIWGITYSFLEIGTYYIVALSLGRPELLPYIMVGEAIGSVFDGIVPYGLYELGMAGVMIALGVDFSTATIITVVARIITLLFTIASGSWPYYKAIKEKR